MSTTTTIPFPSPPPPPLSSATHYYITNLGLGYAIAIAFGFLVLFSSLLLASYICFRHRHSHRRQIRNPNGGGSDNGVMVPSIIFVGEDNNDDQNVVIGLDQSVINSYPKFLFTRGIPKAIDSVCAICLCEYREAEMMRMLPDCKHCFHLTCVDAWLKLNATCPVCRSSPLPTPLSTPLAEVVPLSQYSDGRRRSLQHLNKMHSFRSGDLLAHNRRCTLVKSWLDLQFVRNWCAGAYPQERFNN
ncbi:Zinc finger, RING/FYVE/PHD-type [Cynara cardunculus var. scolymus]|uniref:Zinc finger, RING/FYVE/PHD-type n=1 Tax=Cynara cardunculus var. scolymus TaxID=59895 RepID=A0A103XUS5_CYNCS|nr:Zinc finger, RING/FYVE/PHD-type [Cynara cardunculus var. scolymus]